MKKSIRFKILVSLLLFSSLNLYSQVFPGMGEHMLQKMEFGTKEKKVASRFDVNGKGIVPLQTFKSKALSKIVFGFMPDWEYIGGANNDMHYDLLTHVAAFDFLASSNGSIGYPNAWPWTDVINAAHARGTKVIMAVTNFGGNESAPYVAHLLLTNSYAKNILFNNIKRIITTYQLDGVNIDFEAMNKADRGNLLNGFLSDLTSFIHTELPGKEVSFDGPAVNWGGWNIDGLTQSVDYVFIMTYDYYGSWSKNTGPVAPLTCANGGYCVEKSINNTYGAPLSKYPQKLILGVPYYGKHWKTVTGNAGSATTSFVGSTFYRNAVVEAKSHGGFIWDNASQTPWYKWQSGGWNQVWNDNEKSLGKKYDFALTENIGGVGIWALNYDGTRTELWNLINTKFAGAVTPIPGRPIAPAVLSKDATSITLKFKPGNYADSYRIYQSTDNNKFTMVKETTDTITDVSGLQTDSVYYLKITSVNTAGESNRTHVLAAIPGDKNSEFLIVDGVERRSFDAITQYKYPMTQMGYTFSSASNEAVMDGVVNLNNYKFIIWMLLDESTANDTFNKTEQGKVKEFIDNDKGVFIVSGSEVGWDLVAKGDAADKTFYETYFKARYISDAPGAAKTYYTAEDNNQEIYHFDNGTHGIANIGYPDLIKPINGSVESFTYPGVSVNSGVAGVSYKTKTGGMEYLAFPIEAVYKDTERKELLNYIFQNFSDLLSIDNNFIQTHIRLYPNPTSGVVNIANPGGLKIRKVEVFDMFGKKVIESLNVRQVDLRQFSKGIYIIKIENKKGDIGTFKVIKR